jgi:dTDP-4-dehydrorhamnose 3,5-epimerase-like enzyme
MERVTTIKNCLFVGFKTIEREEGLLTVVEEDWIKRVYYIYDIPTDAERGNHAHKSLFQVMFALHGSFKVMVDDGRDTHEFELNIPSVGLSIPPGIWREFYGFSSGAVCLVLASEKYDENDYIRNYKEFLNYKAWK